MVRRQAGADIKPNALFRRPAAVVLLQPPAKRCG
jgi:hypothetical protein